MKGNVGTVSLIALLIIIISLTSGCVTLLEKPTEDYIIVKGAAWCSSYPTPESKIPLVTSECTDVRLIVPKYDYDKAVSVTKGIPPVDLSKFNPLSPDFLKDSIRVFAEGAEFTFDRVPVPNSLNPTEEVDATLVAHKLGSVTGAREFTCTTSVKLSRVSNPYILGSPYGVSVTLLEGPWGYINPARLGMEGCQEGHAGFPE
jgi:hypothetical protein